MRRQLTASAREIVERLEREAAAIERGALVLDIADRPWEVHHATVSPGAPLVVVRGWPHPRDRYQGSAGGRGVVLTEGLADYLEAHNLEPGIHRRIGVSAPTIARLRRELSAAWHEARAEWWAEREADLRQLDPDAFLARHRDAYVASRPTHRGLSRADVVRHQRAVRGAKPRAENGWYQRPEARRLILSDLPLAVIAEALGVPVAYAKILRARLRHGRR